MGCARFRTAVGMGVILPAAVLLAGCPIPLPSGYSLVSRENLGAEVTNRLVAGVTTREDVLLRLGEPDGTGPDGSWLAYGSVSGRGGVLFVMCAAAECGGAGGEQVAYQRLIVSFDERGLMTNAEFVSRECWEGFIVMGRSGDESPPCMRVNAPGGE